jgi:nitrogen regulatory protein PII
MKIITVIAQQVCADALDAVLPADGIISLTIGEAQSPIRSATSIFRIELQIEDTAVDEVIEGIAFVRGAGLFGEARVRLSDGWQIGVLATGASLAA